MPRWPADRAERPPRRQRGRPKNGVTAQAEPGFGYDPPDRDPPVVAPPVPAFELAGAGEQSSPPPQELLDLGLPPEDAAGIQKWNYRALSTAAALVLRDESLSQETRMKRFAQLTQAASRHYPDAAKFDLAERIRRDAEEISGRKRAKAAAKLERRSAVGGAKVIPIRSDAAGS